MGSKARIAKDILPIILSDRQPDQYYIEPFVGGCNILDKVVGNRIAGDNNHYLIAMWKALLNGWISPIDISREYYSKVRKSYNNNDDMFTDFEKGYIGFCGSYSGRFFDGGYAGIVNTLNGIRNYPKEAFNNVMS